MQLARTLVAQVRRPVQERAQTRRRRTVAPLAAVQPVNLHHALEATVRVSILEIIFKARKYQNQLHDLTTF